VEFWPTLTSSMRLRDVAFRRRGYLMSLYALYLAVFCMGVKLGLLPIICSAE
jgi:hypothetical protein